VSETVTPAAAPVAAAPAPAPAPVAAAPSPSVAPPSGPAPDATLPAAVESPAASSETSVESPASESILSAAKPEEAPAPAAEAHAAEAPAAEAKPDAEKPGEETKAAEPEKPAEPPKPPTYEAFTLPDGVKLDDAKLAGFTGILGETEAKIAADPTKAHEAMQEFGQKAMDLYVAEMQASQERSARLQKEMWDRTQEDWQAAFRNDPILGKNRQETTLARMGALMDMYGSHAGIDALNEAREIFTLTGAGNHIAVLRMFNWMASRLTETARVVTPMMPRAPVQSGSKATRLYRNSIQGAA
jgi:hypothetical protein